MRTLETCMAWMQYRIHRATVLPLRACITEYSPAAHSISPLQDKRINVYLETDSDTDMCEL